MCGLKDRFDAKWEFSNSGCWEWTASKHGRGYGLFYTGMGHKKGKMDYAHRVSMFLYRGMEMDCKLEVCHTCDNTSCVNPEHLFLGSHTDNMRDMMAKGRYVSHNKRLSESDYELAIFMRSEGVMIKDIASHFNIDGGHASRISRG